ncbi:MAG: vitamin K epoxide reductase family protein [Candidatus Bathyarchaeia archaeon]
MGKVDASLRLVALSAILVGVVGASWSWHLLQWYISANALTACILGTQCPLVFQTSFSYFYGVPIHLLAVAWFSLLTLLAVLRTIGVKSAGMIGAVIGAFCVPAVIYLDYIQVVIIHAICSDCELAHILGLILFVLFVIIYRSDRNDKTQKESGPVR